MDVGGVEGPSSRMNGSHAARHQAPRPRNAGAAQQAGSEGGTAPTAPASPELDAKVQRAAKTIEVVLNERTGTRLRIDSSTKQVIAQIVDRNDNVIKQIPPEEALKVAARMRELRGQLFDERI